MPLGRLWNVLVLLLYRRSFFSYSSPSNHKRPGFWSFKNLRLPCPYLPPSAPALPSPRPSPVGDQKNLRYNVFFLSSWERKFNVKTLLLGCNFLSKKVAGFKPKQAKLFIYPKYSKHWTHTVAHTVTKFLVVLGVR